MATPSNSVPNSGTNSNTNAAQIQAQAQPPVAPVPQRKLHDNNCGIFLEFDEFYLFENWLATPNLDLELTALRSSIDPRLTYPPVYQAYVAGTMFEEQRRKFPFVAQHIDITLTQLKLARFGNEMMGIINELQQEMMDTMDMDKEMWERLFQDMRAQDTTARFP